VSAAQGEDVLVIGWRGAAHDEAFRRFPKVGRNEVLAVLGLANPQAGETLVDLPSAGGFLSSYVQTPGLRVISIDPSPVLHALCRQKSLESYQAPMDALPLPAGSVDVVVCLAGLHHEPHLDRVFAEIRRVLRPDTGRLAIAEVVEDSLPGRFLNGFVHRHNSLGHVGTFLNDAFIARLPKAGFRISRNVDVHYHWQFDAREDIGTCLQLMMGIDQSTPDLITEAVATGLGIDALPDGGVGMRWMLRHVLAHPA
jgi:SAM-dependent methyltransferase